MKTKFAVFAAVLLLLTGCSDIMEKNAKEEYE